MGIFDFFKKKKTREEKPKPKAPKIQLQQGYNEVPDHQYSDELTKYFDLDDCFEYYGDEDRFGIHIGDIKEKEFNKGFRFLLIVGSLEAAWVHLRADQTLYVTGDVYCQYYSGNYNTSCIIGGNLSVEKVLDIAFEDGRCVVYKDAQADYLFGEDIGLEVKGQVQIPLADGFIETPDQVITPRQERFSQYLKDTKGSRPLPIDYVRSQIYEKYAIQNPVFRDQRFWDLYYEDLEEIQYLSDNELNAIFAPLGTHFSCSIYQDEDTEDTEFVFVFKVSKAYHLIIEGCTDGLLELYLYSNNQNSSYWVFCIRFEELLQLCIAIREHDPKWQDSNLPFLLLETFVNYGKGDQEAYDEMLIQRKKALSSLGITKSYPVVAPAKKFKWYQSGGYWLLKSDYKVELGRSPQDEPLNKLWHDMMSSL